MTTEHSVDFERFGTVTEDLVRVWAVKVVRSAWVELVRGSFVWPLKGNHVTVQWSLRRSR